jgi:RHO1 GDP-GTP exchange protein 1/2
MYDEVSYLFQDLDLRADTRSLLHTGKLLRQPDGSLDISGWTELFVLLFDNYCKLYADLPAAYLQRAAVVMTKPKEKDGVVKYYVNRRVSFFRDSWAGAQLL